MTSPSHVPKVIEVGGKRRVVYVRSQETEIAMERIRLGPLADLAPLVIPGIEKITLRDQLVIQAPYLMARRLIRTRIGQDRQLYRILSGTTLLGDYFHSNESCRSGFPAVKQLFITFGYIEATNRLLHQVLCETVFTRYESGRHFWLIIPQTIEEMANQWGDGFLNFKMFSFFKLDAPSDNLTPISPAQSLSANTSTYTKKTDSWVRDPSYPDHEDEIGPRNAVRGDEKFAPLPRKNNRKQGHF
jgi:hypothetical protein